MKKILKWLGIVIGAVLVLIIAAGIVIMLVVDEKMIASQMENALNRHVTIRKISAGVFAVASGIEVRDVKISNFKTSKELALLKNKPVPDEDLFVGLKAFDFKLKILPLFKLKFVLDELVLYEPAINVVKYKNSAYNFSDLLKPSETKTKPADDKEEKNENSAPFKASDLPVEITINKIGLEKGQLSYTDQGLGQKFQVYDLTILVHSIKIDPKDLQNKDSVGLKIQTGIKTIGEVKSGTVKSFDMGFDVIGTVLPFDKKTGILNPEIELKTGLPYGTITGLQIFEKIKSVEQLDKYCGKLDFLKKDITWKNAFVNVWYKDSLVKLKDGKIDTADYTLNYKGQANIKTKAVDLEMDMLLAGNQEKSIRSGIEKNIKKALAASGQASKYIKPETITDAAMKKITNNDGKVFLGYEVGGKLNDPNVKLTAPKLPTVKEVIKESAGDIKEEVKEQVKEKAKEEVKKVAEKTTEKAKDKATDKLKKKVKF